MTDKSSAKLAGRYRKQTYLAIILLVVCMGLIVLTLEQEAIKLLQGEIIPPDGLGTFALGSVI
jgi:hypothetical protein